MSSDVKMATLTRRIASLLYDGVLLFGIVVLAGLIYSPLAHQNHALHGRLGLQIFLVLVCGFYFSWMWVHGGQTLAMKTWRIRLMRTDGQRVRWPQAVLRYVLSWLWFLPGWAIAWLTQQHTTASIIGIMMGWIGLYAALTLVLPQKQLLHDVLSKTRLIGDPARNSTQPP